MRLLFQKVCSLVAKRFASKIRFLTVDFDINTGKVTFLLYGGRAFFTKQLFEAVMDNKLISGLHPEQACFLGIMFAQLLKEKRIACEFKKYQSILKRHNYNLAMQDNIVFDRKGNLIYTDKETQKLKIEKGQIIASNKELICQFTPHAACSIGIFVGNTMKKTQKFDPTILKEEKRNVFLLHKTEIKTSDVDG